MNLSRKIFLPLLLALPLGAMAETVEQRLERMERVLESQSLLQMMERLDALQLEVQQLRGQLEEQQHQMESAKERQRELYLDVDRRMSRLEREGGGAAPLPPTSGSETPPLTTGNRIAPAVTPAAAPETTIQSTPTVVPSAPQPPLAENTVKIEPVFRLALEWVSKRPITPDNSL